MMCLFAKPQRRLPLLLLQAQRGNPPQKHVANQRKTHLLHRVPLPFPQLPAAIDIVLYTDPVSSLIGNWLDDHGDFPPTRWWYRVFRELCLNQDAWQFYFLGLIHINTIREISKVTKIHANHLIRI